MKIKNLRRFRKWYNEEVRHNQNQGYDIDFVGHHYTKNNEYIKGFFDIYHGDKPDIGNFLNSSLKIAEDGQAIYEFMQNAADCKSSLFYMFYNEKYFLAVNNGKHFTLNGLRSILNVAQSNKSDSSQIGRFGIGFKLVHRLVGKGDGMEELTKQYKGPVLFSWSKKEDLISLMNNDKFALDDDISDESMSSLLFKFILTNFPATPGEIVRNLDYNEEILFPMSEYNEMSEFVKQSLGNCIDKEDFSSGTIVFIKLGDGKKKLLDDDYQKNFKVGVEYSLNTIPCLKDVRVNDKLISKNELIIESTIIAKDTPLFNEINPEYKDSDINISVGYNYIDFNAREPFTLVEKLKSSPSFYKYFPLGDEKHNSTLFIHSDSFSNEANRRKLHEDTINRKLLPQIAKFINERLTRYSEIDREKFLQLYANILLCDFAHKNSEWISEDLYKSLFSHIKTIIPTETGYENEISLVKIKRGECIVPLDVITSNNYSWFYWDKKLDTILQQARNEEKLGLKTWDVLDIIEKADIEKLDGWISTCDNETYNKFLKELDFCLNHKNIWSSLKEKIRNIKLLRFSDGNFYSYYDAFHLVEYISTSRTDRYEASYRKAECPILFKINKTAKIANELTKLGFIISETNLSDFQGIRSNVFILPSDKKLFTLIEEKVHCNTLTKDEKRNLITSIASKDENVKFTDVGESSIKKLCLCRNNNGEYKPLEELIIFSNTLPTWLLPFQIITEDYFEELNPYLISEKCIYTQIIRNKWAELQPELGQDFYEKIKYYYNLDSEAKDLLDKNFICVGNGELIDSENVFYNKSMRSESVDYSFLRDALNKVFGLKTPEKYLLPYLEEKPFAVRESKLTEYTSLNNESLTYNEVLSILNLCIKNETDLNFFENFVIEKKEDSFYIRLRTGDCYQVSVYGANEEIKEFIIDNCKQMIPLPIEFSEFNDSLGIIKGENFYSDILKNVEDIEQHKETLVAIIKYDNNKLEFLQRLKEIRLNIGIELSKESWEYKIISLAIKVLLEKGNELKSFREKIKIVGDNGLFLHWDDIPNSTSNVVMLEGLKKELLLSEILPNEYKNTQYVNTLIDKLAELDLNKELLDKLFGVETEPDYNNILEILSTSYEVIENTQQVAFVCSMCDSSEREKFKISFGEEKAPFNREWYVKPYSFIQDRFIIHGFEDLGSYLKLPLDKDDILDGPYISDDGEFICPGIYSDLKEEQILDLLSYIRDNFFIEQIEQVDWSKIKIDSKHWVYPEKYALESEKMPDTYQKWLEESDKNKFVLEAMGMLDEDSALVKIRKFLIGDSSESQTGWLYGDLDSYKLENTLKWLSSKNWKVSTETQWQYINSLIDRINENRRFIIRRLIKYNYEVLETKSEEYTNDSYDSWKETTGFSIFLYDGLMPQSVTLDEYITEYPIYEEAKGEVCSNNKAIYVNKNSDIQSALHKFALENDVNFTSEYVYKLFEKNIKELESIISEQNKHIKELERQLGLPSGCIDYSKPNYVDTIQEKRNKITGFKGEILVNELLKKMGYNTECLSISNESDYDDKIEMKGKTYYCKSNYRNYDISFKNKQGVTVYVEVKSTTGNKRSQTNMPISYNELSKLEEYSSDKSLYFIARVFGIDSTSQDVYFFKGDLIQDSNSTSTDIFEKLI